MAQEIKEEFNIDSELNPGRAGIFEVTVDGKLIFSKDELRRFPKNREVNETIKKMKS